MNVAEFVITSLIAVIGLYLHTASPASSASRSLSSESTPTGSSGATCTTRARREPSHLRARKPLTPEEAGVLYGEMTNWYFKGGNGMLLPHDTREMYLEAKRRLGRYALETRDSESGQAGLHVMRDLSIFRSQMKIDLDIYGVFYFDTLKPHDKEFIRACDLDPERWGRPWYRWATSPRYWRARIRSTQAT